MDTRSGSNRITTKAGGVLLGRDLMRFFQLPHTAETFLSEIIQQFIPVYDVH